MMLSAHGMARRDVLQNSCKAETSAQLQVAHRGLRSGPCVEEPWPRKTEQGQPGKHTL